MRSVALQTPSQATVSVAASKLLKRSVIPTTRVQEDTPDGNTEVIVSYLSLNLATH